VTALAAFAVFIELGRRDIVEDNEGQRATPPAEMVRSGHYVIPTINGKDYLAKPPLLYWTISGVYAATGTISPLTARIPTAVSFVILVLGVYAAARRPLGETAARWSALALLTAPYALDRARYAELDVPLTLATFLALIAFRAACGSRAALRASVWTVLGGVALGAAILLKGPVPFLFLLAAWLAQTLEAGDAPAGWLRTTIQWTVIAFGVAIGLWLLSFVVPGRVRFPIPLFLFVGALVLIAWRHGGPDRARYLVLGLVTALIGVAVAAPWGIAVVMKKGWPFVNQLLHSEVLERTHTATRINSGHPLYYVVGLVGMLAPWGLLLPCQFSKEHWNRGAPFYRFALLTGWLSVVVFSMIAGKEYEYVLPAAPFLLIALGTQLAETPHEPFRDWSVRWIRLWGRVLPPLLIVAAVGFLVIVIQRDKPLIVHASLLALAVMALAWYGWKRPAHRLACIAGMALGVVLIWTFSLDYRYTGQRSFKVIAATTGNLVRAGYDVEAAKMTAAYDVFPGFAFYAGANIPAAVDFDQAGRELKGRKPQEIEKIVLQRAADHVREKLEGEKPYFCVVRADLLVQASSPIRADLVKPLLGPFSSKKVILIGNRPLPMGTVPKN
jgi:4-amino-4-deoxy-L-arabinose transferase-like glycosyltransferase